jgi:hypothetical protein
VDESATPARRDTAWRVLIGLGVVAGIVLRVIVLRSHLGTLDSDEAIVGLMARDVVHGHFRTFFWGQPYGGAIEPVLSAPLVALAPTTVVGLKLVPVTLAAIAALIVWRIGRRTFGQWPGAVAGVIAWCWPANYVWWSTKATGFYEALLVCSTGLALVAIRFVQDGPSRREAGGSRRPVQDALLFGLLAGIGWWLSPQVLYAAVPTTVWAAVLIFRRDGARGFTTVAWAIPTFVLGAAPWLVFVARNGLLPLDSRYEAGTGGYTSHLHTFVKDGVPTVLGARIIREVRHIPYSRAFLVFIVITALVALWVRRPRSLADPMVLVIAAGVAYPFLLAVAKNASYVGEGRYEFFLSPWIALLLAGAVTRVQVGALVVGVLTLMTAVGIAAAPVGITSPDVGGKVVPREVAPAVAALDRLGDPPVWSDYWMAMRVRYQSDGRVLAGSYDLTRDPSVEPRVAAARNAAWLFVAGTQPERQLECNLDRLGIAFRRVAAGPYAIILPARPIARAAALAPCAR